MGKADREVLEKRIAQGLEREEKERRRAMRVKLKQERISFATDFKKFITKGNVLDMAVGVVVGTAFNAIVNTLVKSIIMPFTSYFTTGVSIEEWKWVLREGVAATETTEEVVEIAVAWGPWLQTILDFLIVAFTVFVAVRFLKSTERRLRAKELAAAEAEAAKKKAEEEAKAAEQAKEAEAKAAAEQALKDEYYENVRLQSALLRRIADALDAGEKSVDIPRCS